LLEILYYIYNIQYSSKTIDSYHSRIFVRLTNILFYLVCKFQLGARYSSIKHSQKLNSSDKYIVSLTTFPKRINYVWLTVESILRQKCKPDAIILWLSEQEFDKKKSLPKNLLKLEKRGLKIKFVEDNLMPHKKYYYTLKRYPKANIITIDDDVIYPPSLIAELKKCHKQHPESICSTLTRIINAKNNSLQSYKNWNMYDNEPRMSQRFLQIGAGGVLYPNNSLHHEVLNKEVLKEKALKADDLWLKIMALKNDTSIVSLGYLYPRSFVPIIIEDNEQLMESNVHLGRNNKIFNELLDHYALREKVIRLAKNESVQ